MSQCRDLWQLIGQLERRTPFESLRHSLAVQFPYHRLSVLLWLRFLGQLIPTFFRKKYFSSGLLDWGPSTKTIHTKKTLGRSKCWSGEGLDGFEMNSTFQKVSAGFSEEVESGINKQSLGEGGASLQRLLSVVKYYEGVQPSQKLRGNIINYTSELFVWEPLLRGNWGDITGREKKQTFVGSRAMVQTV